MRWLSLSLLEDAELERDGARGCVWEIYNKTGHLIATIDGRESYYTDQQLEKILEAMIIMGTALAKIERDQ